MKNIKRALENIIIAIIIIAILAIIAIGYGMFIESKTHTTHEMTEEYLRYQE